MDSWGWGFTICILKQGQPENQAPSWVGIVACDSHVRWVSAMEPRARLSLGNRSKSSLISTAFCIKFSLSRSLFTYEEETNKIKKSENYIQALVQGQKTICRWWNALEVMEDLIDESKEDLKNLQTRIFTFLHVKPTT